MAVDLEHNEIMLAIGELKGTVNTGFAALGKRLDEVIKTADGQETRLRSVENQQSSQSGRFGAYGAIGGFVSGIVASLISSKF